MDDKCVEHVRKIYGERNCIKIVKYMVDRTERETYDTFN